MITGKSLLTGVRDWDILKYYIWYNLYLYFSEVGLNSLQRVNYLKDIHVKIFFHIVLLTYFHPQLYMPKLLHLSIKLSPFYMESNIYQKKLGQRHACYCTSPWNSKAFSSGGSDNVGEAYFSSVVVITEVIILKWGIMWQTFQVVNCSSGKVPCLWASVYHDHCWEI